MKYLNIRGWQRSSLLRGYGYHGLSLLSVLFWQHCVLRLAAERATQQGAAVGGLLPCPLLHAQLQAWRPTYLNTALPMHCPLQRGWRQMPPRRWHWLVRLHA